MAANFLDLGLPYLLLFAGAAAYIIEGYRKKRYRADGGQYKYQPGIEEITRFIISAFILSAFVPNLFSSGFVLLAGLFMGGTLLLSSAFQISKFESIAILLTLLAVNTVI
ncbi:MAG: hypothetical protein ACE5DI_05240 [Candidatus Micrarchaeia archaeon]